MYGTVRPRGALLRGWGPLPLGRRRCRRGVQSLKPLLAQTMIILRVVLRHHHPGYTNSEPLSQADGDRVPRHEPDRLDPRIALRATRRPLHPQVMAYSTPRLRFVASLDGLLSKGELGRHGADGR